MFSDVNMHNIRNLNYVNGYWQVWGIHLPANEAIG